uniref:Hes family bHLH transcription factor 4 n=1 Tax=Calidris pygmaea TaxID=425635 RepID=A0A8C3JW22_9CHAR
MEKPTASPIAGAPASASHTPDKPRSASEHRKVNGGCCRSGRSDGGAGWRRARGRAEVGVGGGWGGRGGGEGTHARTGWDRPGGGSDRLRSPPQSSKPIMEKRRRARINESLGGAGGGDTGDDTPRPCMGSRHSKLEKADILEMTVKHLRNLQRGSTPTSVPASSATSRLAWARSWP